MKWPVLGLLWLVVAPCLAQQAAGSACRVGAFGGATSPQGTVVDVTMQNNGKRCEIPNFGVPSERANPADSGRIIRKPSHGVAAFAAPNATYLPNRDFVGVDEFQYEAWAAGRSAKQLRLLVNVRITVEQPR
jgi:hypothetical protein